MEERYQTIAHSAEGLYKEKGSKFLAFAEPVSSVEEVRERLDYYRKTYHDARHVCYAYVVRDGEEPEKVTYVGRSSDDGEPSGTARRPIMGRIESAKLKNVLIVVVRYFGGILLGTGGLVVAYREAAADALAHTEIIEKEITEIRTLRFPYEQMHTQMNSLKAAGARIIRQDWEGSDCVIECEVKMSYGRL